MLKNELSQLRKLDQDRKRERMRAQVEASKHAIFQKHSSLDNRI